jgi:thiol-disulfide isomerase/thioredoxin
MRAIPAVILLLASWAVAAAEPPPGLIQLDGRPAPALKLADLDGRTTDLAALRGRWVMVHFWASWCGPCRREMPTLETLAREIPAERLGMVLVNTAETDDEVFAFLTIVAPSLSTLMDRDGRVTERWQPRGLPSSFLVDPDGRLRYLALGGRQWDSPAYLDFLKFLTARDSRPRPAGGQ